MPNKDTFVQILISLTAAALWGLAQGESLSVLDTLQIGFFEVAFLVALCVVMVLTRVILPWLNNWLFESGRRDREDFGNLLKDATKVREWYIQKDDQSLQEKQRTEALHREHDLQIHLELLGIRFFYKDQGLFRDLALLIKLMQRADLKQARKRWPMPTDNLPASMPS